MMNFTLESFLTMMIESQFIDGGCDNVNFCDYYESGHYIEKSYLYFPEQIEKSYYIFSLDMIDNVLYGTILQYGENIRNKNMYTENLEKDNAQRISLRLTGNLEKAKMRYANKKQEIVLELKLKHKIAGKMACSSKLLNSNNVTVRVKP